MLGQNVRLLQLGLQAEALRRDVHAQNIANLNTPGYKRMTVQFEELFRSQSAALPLRRTDPRHLSGSTPAVPAPRVERVADGSMRVDGGGVDLEAELAELAGSALRFSAYLDLISRELRKLRTVIQGR